MTTNAVVSWNLLYAELAAGGQNPSSYLGLNTSKTRTSRGTSLAPALAYPISSTSTCLTGRVSATRLRASLGDHFGGCDNFLYGFQGHAFGAPVHPAPAVLGGEDATSSRGSLDRRMASPGAGGKAGSSPTPGRRPAAPSGREPSGRAAAAAPMARARKQAVLAVTRLR